MTQASLNLFHQRDTQKADALEAKVYAALKDGQWHLRKALCEAIPGLNERAVRMVAASSKGRIIGSSKGYKLTAHATATELAEWERAQRSQAKETLRRIVRTRNCFNRGGRAA